MKLCLGGTFNPIHHGHLLCARAAAEAIGAQEVVIIPNAVPPHKTATISATGADRLVMCRLAVQGVSGFSVDDREIRRGGPSYTIDTVAELRREGWPQVAWLIGADLVSGLPAWHRISELIRQTRLIIISRPGSTLDWANLTVELANLRQNVVSVPLVDISASDIRRRVSQGLPIDFLAPPAVCRFIAEHGLYRSDLASETAHGP